MKNINRIWLLIIGTLLFIISYKLDNQVNLLFTGLRFPLLDVVFGLITNFNLVILAMVVMPSIIFYRNKKKSVYLLWLTFLVSFSRVYFGFHFLSDVVFGMFAGYFIGSLLLKLHEKGKLWKQTKIRDF